LLHAQRPQLGAGLARALEQHRVEHPPREDLDRLRERDPQLAAARRDHAHRVRRARGGAQLRQLGPARESAGSHPAAARLRAGATGRTA
jgi:hypothetical protein